MKEFIHKLMEKLPESMVMTGILLTAIGAIVAVDSQSAIEALSSTSPLARSSLYPHFGYVHRHQPIVSSSDTMALAFSITF